MLIDLQPSAGPALVVGGGTIAARKVERLLSEGFDVVVVAPEVAESIRAGGALVFQRPFEEADIAARQWSLVFACTGVREVNRRAGELARAAGIPVVVSDVAAESTFLTPAVYRDGPLAIAVSTGGGAPAFARDVRDQIAALFAGQDLGAAAERERRRRDARKAAAR
jgi:siroheme synthase-like protein